MTNRTRKNYFAKNGKMVQKASHGGESATVRGPCQAKKRETGLK